MSTINNLPPEPPKHNAHRDGGYRDLQDWEDSELGKGKGDPDISNPPYEKQDPKDTTLGGTNQ